jgi:DNA-damage-inducible protein D
MPEFSVFHFDEDHRSFEDFAQQNGTQYWFASDLARFLEYESYDTFQRVLNKAIGVCMTLNIPVLQNFEQASTEGYPNNYKLSRFACMLAAMNAESAKPQVAKAQAYFAAMADVGQSLFEAETSDRVLTRDELTKSMKTLSSVAKKAGVLNYGYFQDAGYRGMYNMSLRQLKQYKGMSGDALALDFMGSQELAANLFRVTQTSAKITAQSITGQTKLEETAFNVGKTVRATMHEISNTRPENLPVAGDINDAKKSLKSVQKKLNKLGDGNPKKSLPKKKT